MKRLRPWFSAAVLLLGTLGVLSGAVTGAEPGTQARGTTDPPATGAPATKPASLSTNGASRAPSFHREWKRAELLPIISDLSGGRNFTQGREVFSKAMCGTCHALGRVSQGNGISPDLTGVGSKYSRDAILDSILTPSLVISGQYYTTEFRLRNGEVLTGALVDLTDEEYRIAESPLNPEATTTVAKADVVSEQPSAISPMPGGLLDSFTAAQILDLFAFLDAQGDPGARVFQPPTGRRPGLEAKP